MQALGRFRTVAFISLGSRAAMLLLMIELLHRMGLRGVGSVPPLLWLGRIAGLSAPACENSP